MKILDLTAGNRAVWFDKKYRDCIFLDRRSRVKPDFVCDIWKEIPSAIGRNFNLVVFDPPHVNAGKKSNMARVYGHHTASQIRTLIRKATQQAHRVTSEDALMAFKWNNHDQKLETVLKLMAEWWEPLFGHKTKDGPGSQTYWVMLRRRS